MKSFGAYISQVISYLANNLTFDISNAINLRVRESLSRAITAGAAKPPTKKKISRILVYRWNEIIVIPQLFLMCLRDWDITNDTFSRIYKLRFSFSIVLREVHYQFVEFRWEQVNLVNKFSVTSWHWKSKNGFVSFSLLDSELGPVLEL